MNDVKERNEVTGKYKPRGNDYISFVHSKICREYKDHPEIINAISNEKELKYFMQNLYGKPVDYIKEVIRLNGVC